MYLFAILSAVAHDVFGMVLGYAGMGLYANMAIRIGRDERGRT